MIPQPFDVAVLPQMRSPTGASPDSAELQYVVTFEPEKDEGQYRNCIEITTVTFS